MKRISKEIQIHRSLSRGHVGGEGQDCILKLVRFFEDQDNIYILQDFIQEGNSLADLLERRKVLSELEVIYYGK